MSIITSVFHIYGFLITEEAANLILRYTEEVFPDLYKEFSDPESLLAFQEYLCEKLDGCRYGTAESMTVWRIKDQEELDLNPGEEFYIIELKNSSHFFCNFTFIIILPLESTFFFDIMKANGGITYMSIQSDIEMLSIEALEYYAKKYQISEDDAFNIFYKHQVFEKILVQHETLHQLDIHDTFQYVEDIIEEDTPTLVLFHGSNIAFDKIDLNKSHNRRDFGRGFYCTVLEQQANEWANRLYLRTHTGGKYVYRYIFQQSEELKIKHFATLDKEWLEFVKLNRTVGDIQHHYDVVIGPVADDNTMETVQLYLSGILSVDEAVTRLRYNKVNNQVSFHTPLALEHLVLESRKDV